MKTCRASSAIGSDPSTKLFRAVQDMGWRGKKNGELLRLTETVGIQALLTGDKQMQNQQNWHNYPLPVLVLATAGDQYDDYNALIPQVLALLAQAGYMW